MDTVTLLVVSLCCGVPVVWVVAYLWVAVTKFAKMADDDEIQNWDN